MNPVNNERADLLEDARFWALMYEHWVKPREGDNYEDGEHYFFDIREIAVQSFVRKLERTKAGKGTFNVYSVLIPLRHRWKVGVVLSMFPGDFQVQIVINAPSSGEPTIIGVSGGNFKLPALRWEELLELRDAVLSPDPELKAKVVLLLFPSVYVYPASKLKEIRSVLQDAWEQSGIPIRHAAEMVNRPIEDFIESRNESPLIKNIRWRKHPKLGWVNNFHHSLRNPKMDDAQSVIPVVQKLFTTIKRKNG